MKEEIIRKPKSKEKGNPQFPPWEHLDFSLQIEEYFSLVRHLHCKGLNPRTKLTVEHVNQADLNKVFGPLRQFKYNVTSHFFAS
jgi:hypothetical protein